MKRQRGAALLLAMLTVALVATLASAALWRQWRNIEVERNERAQVQASWVLGGALDWARLILREDARASGSDHLGEPWAVVLQESRLSNFLAIDRQNTGDADDVFLSGRIVDAQGRMNVRNLIADGKVSEPDQLAFARLFELLGLETSELDTMVEQLLLATSVAPDTVDKPVAQLRPRRLEQLQWLGLSAASLLILQPHLVLLPARTPLNLNTASAEVIAASIAGLELAQARKLVSARDRAPLRNLADAQKELPADSAALSASQFSVATRYFEVHGRLRMEHLVVEERSLLDRNGLGVFVVWRERIAPIGTGAAPVGR